MKKLRFILPIILSAGIISCSVGVRTSSDKAEEQQQAKAAPQNSDIVELTFLQLNDVYEITPVEGGKFGGMARVASVRQTLQKENPNTFTVLAGDFISPSAIGTSSYEGKRINGAQMVAAMNAVGVDYVCFGNHEFDLGYDALQARIDESKFTWISSNIQHSTSTDGIRAFQKNVGGKMEPFPDYAIIKATNGAGADVKIGIIGLTLGSNKPPYIAWSDPIESARLVYEQLKSQTDFVIGVTHLSIEEDRRLATELPQLKLILGGHEHTNMMCKIGETIISKADANARTVFIHRLRWNRLTGALSVVSEVRTVDSSIPEEPTTAKVVNEWTVRAYAGFEEKGFSPEEIVATLGSPLDGRESTIRFRQTNLGSTIAQAMIAAAKSAKIGIFNSGSVRLDDQLSGIITQYDIIRTLPFGGKMFEVEMKGSLLRKVLDAGLNNAGRGGFLQYHGIAYDSTKKNWLAEGNLIDEKSTYNAVVSDYLFSGNEQGIEFFKREHADVVKVVEPDLTDPTDMRKDIRLAVIAFLKK